MNKPITVIIKDTKNNLAKICNESSLPPVILDLIMQGIYSEIHSLAERQTFEEEMAYRKVIEESSEKADIMDAKE